jgi:hypothetical protein
MNKLTSDRVSTGDRQIKKWSLFASIMPLMVSLGITLASCAAPLNQANKTRESVDMATEEMVVAQADQPGAVPGDTTAIPKPQLIKIAEVDLVTDSVDDCITAINQIVKIQQGDILNLYDLQPTSKAARRSVTMQIRVPQQQLETVLAQISELGEVRRSSINAEDVSNQLVDLQARLVNLRKTEASFLEIMERSGSVSEVLEVAQVLSQTREQIERIDAQLQSLQTRVAYSTISISIEASVTTAEPDGVPLTYQLNQAWSEATQSFASLTVGVIKFFIWLLVYSPYLLAIWLVVWLLRRLDRKQSGQLFSRAISQTRNIIPDQNNQSGDRPHQTESEVKQSDEPIDPKNQ